ncbi:MAG: hypothetical protein ACH0QD_04455 [Tepidibacillus sp.]
MKKRGKIVLMTLIILTILLTSIASAEEKNSNPLTLPELLKQNSESMDSVLNTSGSNQEQINQSNQQVQNTNTGGVLGSEITDFYKDPQNEPSYGERFVSRQLINFANWGFKTLGLKDPVLLIFGKNPREDKSDTFLTGGFQGDNVRESLLLGIYSDEMFLIVSMLYGIFIRFLPVPLVLILTLIGFMIIIFSNSKEGRTKSKDYLLAFLISLLSLRFGIYLIIMIFKVAYFLTDIIWYSLEKFNIKTGLFLDMIWGSGSQGYDGFAGVTQSLGIAFILLAAVIMTGMINYQYTIRFIIITILIVSFPFVLTMSIFPKFRQSATIWWQEMIANVGIVVAHAFALFWFFVFLYYPSQFGGFMTILAYFFGMPTIVALFRSLLQLESKGSSFLGSMGGAMGAMMGITSLMRMGSMFKGRNISQDAMSNLSDLSNQGNSNSFFPSAVNTSPPQRFLPKAANFTKRALDNKWVRGTATAAGATIGSTLSAMATGNPFIGAMAGAKLGQMTGSGIGSIGRGIDNTADFATEAFQNRSQSSIYDTMQSRLMSGQGGKLNNALVNAGWGAQQLLSRATGGKYGSSGVFKKNYLNENKMAYQTAAQNMQAIQPRLEVARENLNAMKAKYGPGSHYYNMNRDPQTGKFLKPDDYVKAEEEYNKLQAEYSTHKTQGLQAQLNMASFQNMVDTAQTLKEVPLSSSNRGRL